MSNKCASEFKSESHHLADTLTNFQTVKLKTPVDNAQGSTDFFPKNVIE